MWWEINPKNKYLLELIKRRPKVQEQNMPFERGLNFDQWKTFSENYKQWEFDYGLFTNLMRIIIPHDFSPSSFKLKRGNPTSPDKIRTLIRKLLVISS